MKLNHNFDENLEETINSCKPLADWFERNQDWMAYFELTHKDCLHFENTSVNTDVLALGRMAKLERLMKIKFQLIWNKFPLFMMSY